MDWLENTTFQKGFLLVKGSRELFTRHILSFYTGSPLDRLILSRFSLLQISWDKVRMAWEQHSDALFSFSLLYSLPLDELEIRNEQQRRKPSRMWNTRWGSLATMLNINSFLERKKNILFLSCRARADMDFGWRCWSTSFYSTNSVLFSRSVSTIW